MTIAISPLQTIEDMRSAVALQQMVLGKRAPAIWQRSHLSHVQQSGGLLLGACESAPQTSDSLDGLLVDLLSEVDGYPARRTVVWGVCPTKRNRGIGTRLRIIERRILQKDSIDLVHWDADPLNSGELHIALNTLGGILTGHRCDTVEAVRDGHAPALIRDCARCEWWIDAPRVISVLDQGRVLPHHHISLHEMEMLTKTTILPSGMRGIIECGQQPTAEYVLAEIPENLDNLQARDPDAAIQWRLQSRGFMAQLFQLGYLGVGLVHEGGRSFLLFKKGTRRSELGAADKR
jgi:predicted GNAT superfamily acetyltransferase